MYLIFNRFSRLIIIDSSDDESVNKAKVEVEKKLGNNRGLNCLLNNAAVNQNTTLDKIDEKVMLETYRQNVLGPWRVTKVSVSCR